VVFTQVKSTKKSTTQVVASVVSIHLLMDLLSELWLTQLQEFGPFCISLTGLILIQDDLQGLITRSWLV
jgi:hypothetical protein